METISLDFLARYWSPREVSVNIIVFANVLGALLLGLLIGYERSYHGRAAGMRTYGLVCMASCALTVIVGFPSSWFGGMVPAAQMAAVDPTRVIQGIVTGVGFLGAGVIMKEGLNISGLTTAASIWSSSAIGVLVGLGFYFAAILVAVISAALMMWAAKLEQWLPSRAAFAVMLRFRPGFLPTEQLLTELAHDLGYSLAGGTFQIQQAQGRQEWRFVAIAQRKIRNMTVSAMAASFGALDGVEEFHVTHARN
jgi:putative Mg2+ transporter-C (MgtC) family protein